MNENWKTQFAVIYVGQFFSLIGSAAVQFAVIWWLTIKTESAMALTIATIVTFLPNMFIGPFAGVWIDRFNRRTVMMASDSLVALSSVILGVAFLLVETPPIWFIYVILFLRGLGNTFHSPAMQAAIPTLVPADMLTKAGGWGTLITSGSNILGPALGAILMQMLPLYSIMLVDIFGALFAVFCLSRVEIPDIPQSGEKIHILDDLKQGINTMRSNRPLVAVFFPMVLVNILYAPLGTLFPLLVRVHFLGDAWHNSVVEVVFSVGLLVSSAAIGIWGGMKRRFLMAAMAICLLGVTSLVSGILPQSGFWSFVVCCFFMGISGTLINIPIVAYTQETVAPKMIGKVLSLIMTAMTLSMPVGLLLAGPVSEYTGVDTWFFWSGIAIVVAGVLCRLLTKRYDSETMKPEKIVASEE